MLIHRAGFDPTKPFVVAKDGFKVGRAYAVGEGYTPTPDIGLRMLRQWYDYGWLKHPVNPAEGGEEVAPLHGDGPEPPVAPVAAPATPQVVGKSGKVRVQDPVTKKLMWVTPAQAEAMNGVRG